VRVLQDQAQRAPQAFLPDAPHIDAVIGDAAALHVVEPVDEVVSVVLPAPVEPTKAIICPGLAYRDTFLSTGFPGT
jgi:hypothetical protein